MSFHYNPHLMNVHHIASCYEDMGCSIRQISAQYRSISPAQVKQCLDILVEKGYGVYRLHAVYKHKPPVLYFFCRGSIVPWTGELVECEPDIDWTLPEAQPTTIEPGPQKVALLAKRYENGLPLHIDGDVAKRSEDTSWGIWT